MIKIKKLATLVLAGIMAVGMSVSVFATESNSDNRVTRTVPAEKITDNFIRDNLINEYNPELGTIVNQDVVFYEDGSYSIITSYELDSTRSHNEKSIYATNSKYSYGGHTKQITIKVSATLFYNKSDNTAYTKNEKGQVTYNKDGYKFHTTDSSTDQGGGAFGSKHWASADL